MFYGFRGNYESEAAEPLTANLSDPHRLPHSSSLFVFQLSENIGATTVLVIKCRRHVCVCVFTYLTHAHKHTGRLLSISSEAHLQLSQQVTKEDLDSGFSAVVREEPGGGEDEAPETERACRDGEVLTRPSPGMKS